MKKSKQKEKFFTYGYISKDKVLQKILKPLLCQCFFTEAESLSYCDTEQEIIDNNFSVSSNDYFNNLPLKYKLFLIINFIRGISDPESLPENLDHSFYITVDHLFNILYQEIECEIDMESEDYISENEQEKEEWESYKYIRREYLRKCLHIMQSDNPPEKSVEVFDIQCYNHEEDIIDEDGRKFDLDIIREGWEEEVGYLQGQLFGGFREGEFTWYKDHVSGFVKEQKLLSQLCVNYSLLELVKQYVDIISEYGNIDLLQLKGT